jgi:hypothetical protein
MTEPNENTAAPQPTAQPAVETAAPVANVNPVAGAEQPVAKGKFTIGEDVKSFNRKDFTAGIHKNVYLTKVEKVVRKVGEEEKKCLEFTFTDADGRMYSHLEWPVEELDPKFDNKWKGLSERINHMSATLLGAVPPANTYSGNTMEEFFDSVARHFNITDDKGATKWKGKALHIKLVYVGKNLSFPLSPNFIDPMKVANNVPKATTLTWNHKYDFTAPRGGAGISAAPSEGFSGFGGEGDNLPLAVEI